MGVRGDSVASCAAVDIGAAAVVSALAGDPSARAIVAVVVRELAKRHAAKSLIR